jgi:hypothetical protein
MKKLQNSWVNFLGGSFFIMTFIILPGCASIVNGGPGIVTMKSNPSDAKLTIYNMRTGDKIENSTTPHTATLKRGAGYFKSAKYRVVIEKEGYESKEFEITGKAGGWYIAGNLVFGGLIGWLAVDPATGAMWVLRPKEINAELVKKQTTMQQENNLVLFIKEKLYEMSDEFKNNLEIVKVLDIP